MKRYNVTSTARPTSTSTRALQMRCSNACRTIMFFERTATRTPTNRKSSGKSDDIIGKPQLWSVTMLRVKRHDVVDGLVLASASSFDAWKITERAEQITNATPPDRQSILDALLSFPRFSLEAQQFYTRWNHHDRRARSARITRIDERRKIMAKDQTTNGILLDRKFCVE